MGKKLIVEYEYSKNIKMCSVDIDGILNYYPDCWIDFINQEKKLNFKDKNEAQEGLTIGEYRHLKDEYRKSDFKANLKIRKDALKILKLLKNKKYFILIVTARPFEDYPLLFATTKNWLEKNNFPFDALEKKTILTFKKYHGIDFHIENELKDANLIAEAGFRVFLFGKQYSNKTLHPNIIKIKYLEEILKYVSK